MRKTIPVFLALLAVVGVTWPVWKPYAKKNKWFLIATNVGLDSLRRYGFASEQISHPAVLTFPESQIPTDLKRIRATYERYLSYSGLSHGSVAGKRVIELGPGATVGVPLLFAADNAANVAAIDKFVRFQDGPYFKALYSRLRDSLNDDQKKAFDRAILLEPKPSLNPPVATYIAHMELPDCVQQLGADSYDLIVSNDVIEEIYDPTPYFEAQRQLLRPGGVMVHRVDLRDYGMFSKYGFHPLEFLTVPDWVYRRMVEGSGQPDRRLIDYYREIGPRLGLETEVYITRILGVDVDLPEPRRELRPGIDYSAEQVKVLETIRPRLLERYRKLPDQDLIAMSIVFVGRKPLSRFRGGGAPTTGRQVDQQIGERGYWIPGDSPLLRSRWVFIHSSHLP
jgi:SAM-dependent methyltransferase